MPTGTIKKLVSEKGFGFITPDDASADVFFHTSVCQTPFDSLQEGKKVSFETESVPGKGPRATTVTVA